MAPPRPKNWLDMAANKGTTKWLQRFIHRQLALLETHQITPDEFANELEEEFACRMLDTPKQQKNYRSNVVQALKGLDDQHPAIPLIALSTEEYRRLNDQQKALIADRETKFIDSDMAETLVEAAEALLDSDEWADVGAGLAVLIGRRISEILLSRFSLKTPWSLHFTGMAKKADDQGMTIEIPTLAPADTVLAAIERLQSALAIADLRRNSTSSRQVKQKVNQRFSLAISQKCDAYFSNFVPARTDKENLYTHLFRAVYATIAAHWFCPPNVPEHQFKAEIQGHFTLSQDGQKLPNYSARSNYDDYAIGDGQGNRDGRLGIKLGQVPGLTIIDAFRHTPVESQDVESQDVESQDVEPQDVESQDVESQDVESQDTKLAVLEADAPTPPASAQAEITREKTETETEPAPPPILHEATETTEDVPPMAKLQECPTKRLQLRTDDLDRLRDLMAHEGVTGSPAELFHALLDVHATLKEAYDAMTAAQQQQQTQTISEVAQTFHWFTQQIDTLKAQNHVLAEERDRLQTQPADTQPLTQLTAENTQLKRELTEAKQQLEGIYQVLGKSVPSANGATAMSTANGATAVSASAPTPSPEPVSPTPPPSAPPADTSPASVTRQRDRTDSKTKVEAIVQDIINWNTAQPTNSTRLRISVSIIKALGSLVSATYQPVIMEVLNEQKSAIDEMHQRFMLGSRHNVSIDKDSVLQAIARDYMGVENWQEAHY